MSMRTKSSSSGPRVRADPVNGVNPGVRLAARSGDRVRVRRIREQARGTATRAQDVVEVAATGRRDTQVALAHEQQHGSMDV